MSRKTLKFWVLMDSDGNYLANDHGGIENFPTKKTACEENHCIKHMGLKPVKVTLTVEV